MARSLSQLFYALGGSVSPGKSNDELIDHLIDAEFIRTPAIQRVFRSVDRGNYYHPNQRCNAYKDIAWRMGNLHLSAPCVYSVVMETLKLKPGLSFLNLGSGSGYLSTMAGLLLGQYGINHGIEFHKEIVEYAYERLDEFLKNSKVVDENDFCEPVFTWGNCLTLDGNVQQYDRVYCGAACPEEYEGYIKNLVKINGILIMPLNDKLLKITRVNETVWTAVKVLSVSFAPLILPPVAKKGEIVECAKLGDFKPPTLLQLCRFKVRAYLRDNIEAEHPKLIDMRKKLPSQRSALKLFIVNCGDEGAAEDSESDTEDLDSFSLLMRSLHRTSLLLRNFSNVEHAPRSNQTEEIEGEVETIEDYLKFATLTTVRDASSDVVLPDLTQDVESDEETALLKEAIDRSFRLVGAEEESDNKSNQASKQCSKTSNASPKVEKKTKNRFETADSSSKSGKKTNYESKTADSSSKSSKGKKSGPKSGGKSKNAPKASSSSVDPIPGTSSKAKKEVDSCVQKSSSPSHSLDTSSLPPSYSTRSRTNTLKRKHSGLDDGPSTSAGCSSPAKKAVRKPVTRKQTTKNEPTKETFSRAVKLDSDNKVVEEFSHTYFLTQRIAALPLPTFLKQYINYKRENF